MLMLGIILNSDFDKLWLQISLNTLCIKIYFSCIFWYISFNIVILVSDKCLGNRNDFGE